MRFQPGLAAEVMDSLADWGNFTWRQSFAVIDSPDVFNKTWSELLLWAANSYYVAVDWYHNTAARMADGVSFPEPRFDGSAILVDIST